MRDAAALKAAVSFRALAEQTHTINAHGRTLCPFHEDTKPDCRIYPDGFKCYACGAHGDHITWLERVHGLSTVAAFERLEALAGTLPKAAPKARPARQRGAEREIKRLLAECQPLAGSLAHRYLIGRGLRDPQATDLHFHPAIPWAGQTYPALIAVGRDRRGCVQDAHRTLLDGPRKANIDTPKLKTKNAPIIPGARYAVRLFPTRDGRLGVAEGIETALAAAQLFGLPVWACLDTAGLANFEPPEGVHEIHIFSDRDRSGAGQQAAATLDGRLLVMGITATEHRPPHVGDWLDVLTQAERKAA